MKRLLTCLFASLMMAFGSASMDTCSLDPTGECAGASGLCPLKARTIQLFDSDNCTLNATSFNAMMGFAVANYGPNRAVVFVSADAETGQGKSMFSSMLLNCPSQFKSECTEGGSVTKGVWTHDKPLTCCALARIHGIADTSKCPCECHHDARDLDAATNTCPLIYVCDVEGSRDKDVQCSLSPFYVLSQAHLRVIRTERVSPVMATSSSLILVNKLKDLMRGLGNNTVVKAMDFGSNHELHFLNLTPNPNITAFLKNCGANGKYKCGAEDEANRDMVLNFYEQSGRVVDTRFFPTFFPRNVVVDLLTKADGYCRSGEEQAANMVTLFKHHLSPNFTEQLTAYVRDELAPLTGLKLPLITGSAEPLTLGTMRRVLPVLVDSAVQKEQGCPIDSMHCTIQVAKCLTILADDGIADLIDGQWTAKASAISHSANSIEVLASSFDARSELLSFVRFSGLLPAQCFQASNQTIKLISAAQPAMDALVTTYEARVSALTDKKSYHLRKAATAVIRSDQASGIFGEINGQNAVRDSLSRLNEVVKDEVGNDIILSGLYLPIDGSVAMGRSIPLGTNFYLKGHKLVVPPGDWVLYAPGRSVHIEASEIELQGSLTIDVSGLDGAPSVPYPASNGKYVGHDGSNGLPGLNGSNAGSILINAINITTTGSGTLFLFANGGHGSTGQMAGNGYVGKDGEHGQPNHNCGRGGDGKEREEKEHRVERKVMAALVVVEDAGNGIVAETANALTVAMMELMERTALMARMVMLVKLGTLVSKGKLLCKPLR